MHRRTLVKGAAWTIPVVAMATATPAAAASVTPTLAFVNGPYTVDSCGKLNNVTLRLTTDGTTADPSKPVTVTLPAGFTWADGSSAPRSFTTDSNGRVVLPTITPTQRPGDFPISASSGQATGSSSIAVSKAATSYHYLTGTSQTIGSNPGTVTDGVKVFKWEGGTAILDKNGNLYRATATGWALAASGVRAAYSGYERPGVLTWVTNDGKVAGLLGTSTTPYTVPGSVANPARIFKWRGGTAVLDTAGNLYNFTGSGFALVDTNVIDGFSNYEAGNSIFAWLRSDGVVRSVTGTSRTPVTQPGVVNGGQQVFKWQGGTAVLTASGDLYRATNTGWARIATNVAAATADYENPGVLTWVTKNGSVFSQTGTSTTTVSAPGNVANPARIFKWQGSTAVLDTAGNLYNFTGSGFALVDTNVIDGWSTFESGGSGGIFSWISANC
ncbi:hypothetical protein [Rathayibacter tanaceti]|uniref:Tachylectin n=1 Tax=Rathayibacter tanaceti TaxID=1671680 RepID=A0A166H2X0_9MICO|nr:hypothetical protein [Rathayibacter tanaceti]KZX19835.1 hypothetical protein ACH61_03067 [Rathayibacter tanaceti]